MQISYSKFTFKIRPRNTLRLPPYKGSAFRGSFMHTFRKTVCITMQSLCDGCIVRKKCAYYSIFESDNNDSSVPYLRNVKKIPHPFILEPPLDTRTVYTKDDTLSLNLVLIGSSVEYLPYFVYTITVIGRGGMKWRGGFDLEAVEVYTDDGSKRCIYDYENKMLSEDIPVINACADMSSNGELSDLELLFVTPTRIVHDNKLTMDITADILLKNLYRRIAALSAYHCKGTNNITVHPSFGEDVHFSARDLRWYDWERYSNRQNTRMKMGGFLGSVKMSGNVGNYQHLLSLGEVLHIGKGTSFGLGKYKVVMEKRTW